MHKRDLIHYSEALESGRPSIGDDMAMRKTADIPMAAMWTYPKGNIGPQPSYWGDIRGAASVAHIYGQNLVAAESLTAAMSFWSFAPRDLQPMIDMEFALGVNRPVIHTSVHQPLTDKMPGFSLWIFGQYFSRLETWGEMAKPWIDYISRNSYMLQQGRFAADVAYFYGEESPITALYDSKVPTDTPTTTGFDYVNADVVLNQLSNDGRDLVAKSGARYRLIYLGGTSRKMTLPVLKRLDALVQGGATLVGAKPEGTPSLSDDPAAFAALANALWGGATGKGRVLASTDVNVAFKTLGIAPDFTHTQPASDTTVMFVHRTTPDADIYYFTNRKDRTESVDLSFRMTGKIPELWDAATGASTGVGFDIKDGRTTIPMVLRPYQSGYIVFRKSAGGVTGAAKGNMVVKSLGDVSGPWSLSFQSGRGAPARVSLPQLIDWSKDKSPEIKYFSGIGTYRHDLVVPLSALGKGQALMLDLGDVHDVAEVLVNGKAAGTLWKAPYRLDISGVAKTGKNTITFTTLKTYTAGAPLRPSGLIGPVKLETETR
jgi:alpha-L-rhamnosidase